jgi:hypothetical protein
MEPAHASLGPPWCALLALLLAHATPQLCFSADIEGRGYLRSMHAAHWTHLLSLLEAVRTRYVRRHRSPPFWGLVPAWRDQILPDLICETHQNVPALRQLVRMLLHETLPVKDAPESALLEALLTEATQRLRGVDPYLTYMRWGALGTVGDYAPEIALRRIREAWPHCARRTLLAHRALRALPFDLRVQVMRLHNRSLILLLPPREQKEGEQWDLRLRLLL